VIVLPITYEPIATTTLSSATATVTFSSISGSYTDLVLVCNAVGSTLINTRMRFNSDTGSNYSYTVLGGDGSAASSFRSSNSTYAQLNYYSYLETTLKVNHIVQIMNYSNATTYKSYLSRGNNAANGVDAIVGLWRSTSAITTVTLSTNTGTFESGSTFSLYGIKSA